MRRTPLIPSGNGSSTTSFAPSVISLSLSLSLHVQYIYMYMNIYNVCVGVCFLGLILMVLKILKDVCG
ncbi:hypothetical protein TEA_021054 [Camellia sinensis var. sinensis]|uniref:Transmembrane protein n=1 Tax=Camellia sinensis var. sinensis TaxID=542762 RepID=A0A4S4E864_CAMSN|nr:hypothetical protein TEA_021054 [Camellia sinensis var. sinensis]